MGASKMVKNVLGDMRKTIEELYAKNLIRDYMQESCREIAKDTFEISFSGKDTNVCNIVYDKHISGEEIIDKLLGGCQYTVLLYDKSIIQAEFTIEHNEIVKERLVFMKRHNKIWDIDEINESENLEQDWFSEEKGIPIVFRVDYAPNDHIDGEHSATHLTLANHESCRVPIKGIVTFSEFIRFILLHFYNIEMEIKQFRAISQDTITVLEKQMVHINWE
ncbi:MAG: DUF2290 domain-containing protein [Lachnospiraceae bacterium]|nr:DUF2290 domain-containing protein [Lachnospiraceae bacterium]